jgi:FkbM family methyltransferase
MIDSIFSSTKKFVGNFSRAVFKRSTQIRVRFGPSRVATDLYGTKFWVNSKNALDVLNNSPGGFDHGFPYMVSSLTTRLEVAIDVGANAGYYAIPLATQFRRVIAFEPIEDVFTKLRINVGLNELNNVELHQAAVSDFDGSASFYAQEAIDGDFNLNLGLSSLIRREKYFKSEIEVEGVSLDNFLEGVVVDFIKVDVEGSEYQVFQGAMNLIRSSKPVILWEASTNLSKSNVLRCYDLLTSIGYANYLVVADKDVTPISREDLENLDFDLNILSTISDIESS